MFTTTRTLFQPLQRFRAKAKIPVIITKDFISTEGRPYFAGEKRRVKKGVMRYILYPNKIAVYSTKENEQAFEKFWKENPNYKEYLKEKKTLYSLECYLKTKSLVISEPITKDVIKRFLDYSINLEVPTTSIEIQRGKDVPTADSPGVRHVSVFFNPVGYEMKFNAVYSTTMGVPFNHFAYDKLNLKAKDPALAEMIEEEINAKSKNAEKEQEMQTATADKRDSKKSFTNEWIQDKSQKLSKEERTKQNQMKQSHLLKLREESLKRAGGVIVDKKESA